MAEQDPDRSDPETGESSSDSEGDTTTPPEEPPSSEPSPEELAREVLDESEQTDPTIGSTSDDPDPSSSPGHEEVSPEDDEEASDEQPEDSDGSGSIQDMLQQEAERARQTPDEPETEAEDGLPEGYLSAEELPEEEERQVPAWFKKTMYGTGIALLVGGLIWFVVLPTWESYLTMQIHQSLRAGNVSSAASWVRLGTGWGGWLIKFPDAFLGDYLNGLIEAGALARFESEYRALRLPEKTPRIQQAYTQYLLNRGRWAKARNQADRLLQLPHPEIKGIGTLFLAKAHLEMGELGSAADYLKQARAMRPEDPELLRVRRDLDLNRGNTRAALQAANELMARVEGNGRQRGVRVRDYLQLATIHRRLKKYRVMEQMLQSALQLDPRNREALKALARRYVLQRRWKLARERILGRDGIPGYRRLYPYDSFGWWSSAELALSEDRVDMAILRLQRARYLNGRDPEVYRVRGEIYLRHLNQPGRAVEQFERARGNGLRRVAFAEKLARAYYLSGGFDRAVSLYTRISEALDEENPRLVYNIGSSHLGAGQYRAAEEFFARVYETGEFDQKIFSQWALALELQEKRQQAFSKLDEGLQWADRNGKSDRLLQKQLDRMFEDRSPRPLFEWLAPPEKGLNVPYWKTLADHSETTAF